MREYLYKRFLRAPMGAVSLILTSAVLTAVLCSMHMSALREAENYEQISRTTPVTLTVTNLTGTDPNDLQAPSWVLEVFLKNPYAPDTGLSDYIRTLHAKMETSVEESRLGSIKMAGITDLAAEETLILQTDGAISWLEGYGPECLSGSEDVCIVPVEMVPADGSMALEVTIYSQTSVSSAVQRHTRTLKIVGTHQAGSLVYCPFATLQSLMSRVGAPQELYSIQAVVADNSQLETVREQASRWFAQPTLSGERIPWNYLWYDYYPYALKIDDSQLRAAEETMQNGRTINAICMALVFALSAMTGFLTGFLTVRGRKREIMLMRTLGTAPVPLFCGILGEQTLWIILGTFLGGWTGRWQPAGQLLIFSAVFAAGLTLALAVFMGKNLLATIKEDE